MSGPGSGSRPGLSGRAADVAERAPRTTSTLMLPRERSIRFRPRTVVVTTVLVLIALAVAALGLSKGDLAVPLRDVVASLLGRGDPGTDFIVLELRLPRVLLGLLVGAALGLSGAIFQSITRNPLGSPDFVGLTIGSSTGALVVILIVGGSATAVSLGALAGCVVTSAAVYLLAFKGGSNGIRLVLVGVGVSAMLGAFNSFLITRARLEDAATAQVWQIGSLNGRGWSQVLPLAVVLALLLPVGLGLSRQLGLLGLGDEMAAGMGIAVERTRTSLILVAVLLVAAATAAAGPIAFVALAAPQLAQRLTRAPDIGMVAPAAMGATLLATSDLAAQRLPTPLPTGILTAAIGGAYLTWLLVHEWRRHG